MSITTVPVEDRVASVNGLRLHYREWGDDPSAEPLLVLHGITGHAWEFDRMAAALADRYRVLALNQRGHGASSWAQGYTPELMANDVAALLDSLGIGKASLVGHSMGGVNGWWFAARHPERIERLAILDISPQAITERESAQGLIAMLDACSRSRYGRPEEAVAEYLRGYAGDRREELRKFVLDNLTRNSEGDWLWRFDAKGLAGWIELVSSDQEEQWRVLRKVVAPTLIVMAADSRFTDWAHAQRMERELPRARAVEVSGAGHDVHIDQLGVLVIELRAFLLGSERQTLSELPTEQEE